MSRDDEIIEMMRCPIDGTRIITKWRCENGHEFKETNGILDFLTENVESHELLERVAPIYESLWAPLGLSLTAGTSYSSLMSSAASSMGERHLDVGTGTGKLFDYGKCRVCVGLDVSLRFLNYLKKKRPNVIAVRADARRLPFKDSSFDSASSLFVIHMLDDPSLAIQEIHRVLKDKGRAVLTVMTDNNAIDKILSRWWGLSLRSYDYYLGVLTRYFEVDKARKMGAWSYFEVVKS